MSETANLIIKVDSDGVAKADSRLEHMGKTADHTEKASDELTDTLKELALAYLSLEGALKFTEKLFDVTKEFQVLSAQVKIAVGDGQDVTAMFEQLQEIAGKTPFSLKEVTDAFTLLTNRGLDPSTEALENYSKVAVALNTSLDGVTDAVANAAQGQFRGLQQLGVKVNETADGLILTFRGVNTTIKKDAEEIQEYIQNIGKTNFGTALEDRAKTLEGTVSDLHKAWDELFISISSRGAAELMAKGITLATDAIKLLRAEIESGRLRAIVEAIGQAFAGWGTDAEHGLNVVIEESGKAAVILKENLGGVGGFLRDAFVGFPANIRYVAQLMGIALADIKGGLEIISTLLKENMVNALVFIVKEAQATGKELRRALNPFDTTESTFEQDSKQAFDKFAEYGTRALLKAADATAVLGEATEQNLDAIDKERNAVIASTNAKLDGAQKLRAEYEYQRKVQEMLAKFGVKDPLAAAKPKTPIGHINTSEDAAAFEALKKSLQIEEISIAESYKRRRELIVNNTKGNNDLQLELLGELDKAVNEEYANAFKQREDKILSLENELNQAIADGRLSIVDSLRTQLEHEEELVQKSYETRKKLILSDTKLTADQQNALIAALDKQRVQSQAEQARAHQKVQLDQASDFFGNLATISKAFGRKGFEAAKAASIVQATIKTYESATSAYASLAGIPYIGPALGVAAAAAAIAAGVANVAAIRSQSYSGAYDTGGMIPSGKYGVVGEHGPEFVQGPAVVTSRRATADLNQGGGDSSGGMGVVINVQNFAGADVDVKETDTNTGKQIDLIIRRVTSEVVGQIQNGGQIPTALQRTYGLKRGAA